MEMLTSIINWMKYVIRQIISMNGETANIRQKPLQTIKYSVTDKKHFKGITVMTFYFLYFCNVIFSIWNEIRTNLYTLSLNSEETIWFQYDHTKAVDENGK